MPERIAVLEVGSTAVKSLAGDATRFRDGGFSWGLFDPPWGWQTARRCGLEAARGESGAIGENAADAAAAIAGDLARELDARGFGEGARDAIATAAIREATNGAVLADRIARAIGGGVRTVSATEEATLAAIACAHALPSLRPSSKSIRMLVVDAGGGSTEIAVAELDPRGGVSLVGVESVRAGTASLARELAGVPLARAYAEVRSAVAASLARSPLRSARPDVAVATGSALARIRARKPRALHGRELAAREVDRAVRERYLNRAGVADSARAVEAAVGVPVVLAALAAFGCDSVVYSAAGVRFGAFVARALGLVVEP